MQDLRDESDIKFPNRFWELETGAEHTLLLRINLISNVSRTNTGSKVDIYLMETHGGLLERGKMMLDDNKTFYLLSPFHMSIYKKTSFNLMRGLKALDS